ncbi:MAG: vanadium-dependent haloperoxidase [Bacteroidota bacterium]
MRKQVLLGRVIVFVCGLLLAGCGSRTYTDAEVATTWAEMTLRITKGTPGNSPTYASRCLGYIGLTMYESAVAGAPQYRSIAGHLSNLPALPGPEGEIDYALAVNAGQAEIIRKLYNQTSDANKASIDSLEREILLAVGDGVGEATVKRSVAYGQRIARSVFEWSKSDGGHRAYLRNFDKKMIHPDFPGSWKPPLYAQAISHHPLHPTWGQNRPLLPTNYGLEAPDFLEVDTTEGSPYYEQFRQVYEAERALTQEQKEIAIWWGDDPDETFTPPGHSYYLATMLVKARNSSLIECAQTYAATGMAVADAFINCWKWKYQFFSERPNTFIPRYIDQDWESFWPDPPFPSFPSGHAIQAAAAMTVLKGLHGNEFTFTDRSHVGRKRDEVRDVDFRERSFTTLWDVALETADSRFYGGIHLPIDNQAGLEKGALIGENVLELQWKE